MLINLFGHLVFRERATGVTVVSMIVNNEKHRHLILHYIENIKLNSIIRLLASKKSDLTAPTIETK